MKSYNVLKTPFPSFLRKSKKLLQQIFLQKLEITLNYSDNSYNFYDLIKSNGISKFKIKYLSLNFLCEVLTYFFRSNRHRISSTLIWASVKVVKLELMVDRIRCSIPRTFHRRHFINTTQSPTIQLSFHSMTFEW